MLLVKVAFGSSMLLAGSHSSTFWALDNVWWAALVGSHSSYIPRILVLDAVRRVAIGSRSLLLGCCLSALCSYFSGTVTCTFPYILAGVSSGCGLRLLMIFMRDLSYELHSMQFLKCVSLCGPDLYAFTYVCPFCHSYTLPYGQPFCQSLDMFPFHKFWMELEISCGLCYFSIFSLRFG